MNEPLTDGQVKKLARSILADGAVHFPGHALDEMEKDSISKQDCANIIRGGLPEGYDFENGSFRYRIHTRAFCVVVAFRDENTMVVVTAWRKRMKK